MSFTRLCLGVSLTTIAILLICYGLYSNSLFLINGGMFLDGAKKLVPISGDSNLDEKSGRLNEAPSPPARQVDENNEAEQEHRMRLVQELEARRRQVQEEERARELLIQERRAEERRAQEQERLAEAQQVQARRAEELRRRADEQRVPMRLAEDQLAQARRAEELQAMAQLSLVPPSQEWQAQARLAEGRQVREQPAQARLAEEQRIREQLAQARLAEEQRTSVTTGPTQVDDAADRRSIENQLRSIDAQYKVPDQLLYKRSSQVIFVLEIQGKGSAKEALSLVSGQQTAVRVAVSRFVRAKLSGAPDMVKISLRGGDSAERQYAKYENVQWIWDVEGLQAGQVDLYLQLFAEINIDGKSENIQIRTYQKKITIQISFIDTAKVWSGEIMSFWPFLAAVGPALMSVFVFFGFRKPKDEKLSQNANT